MEVHEKTQRLRTLLADLRGLVVAFSGGVDSTFLAAVAHQVLGDRMLAVTARSETYPSSEAEEAGRLAKELGFRHRFINTSELGIAGYADNPPNRCFYCKSELFGKLIEIAKEEGLNFVADGANADDTHDFRPGMKAAAALGVRSPLKEAGLTKAEIRALSREMGLPTWNKPAFACLASRFPYGTKITAERLAMVEAAEEFLRSQGIRLARVRHHPVSAEIVGRGFQTPPNEEIPAGIGVPALQGQEASRRRRGYGDQDSCPTDRAMARIEVAAEDIPRFLDEDFRRKVIDKLKAIGYLYVCLDLQGYRSGSMNEGLGI